MLDKLSNSLRLIALTAGIVLLCMNVAVVGYSVAARYLFGGAPIWTDELARFVIIGTVLLAAGAAWLEGAHMRVGILERSVPPALGRLMRVYQWLMTLGLTGYAAWVGWQYAWSVSAFRTMGLGISKSLPLLALPIGFGLLFLHALLRGPRPLPTVGDEIENTAHEATP